MTDGDGGTASDTLVLTVTAVNDAPTISDVADKTTNEDTATAALGFTVGDVETAAGSLTSRASSSNTTLVPVANIVFGGSGANRTVTITPAPNQIGHDHDHADRDRRHRRTASDTFVLTVTAVNDAPTISDVADQTTNEDTATAALSFTVGDVETAGRRADRHGDLVEPDAGADREHRLRRQRREPHGDGHAGAESDRARPRSR